MSEPNIQPFSQLLRQWRKQFNLSQVSACLFLRVPYRTYQDWENERRNPKQLTREAVEERMKKYESQP
jgi:DNA-binding transcriptional regulator YiaG